MKVFLGAVFLLIFSPALALASANSLLGGWFSGPADTQADYCHNCQKAGVSQIDLNRVGGTKSGLENAVNEFKTVAARHRNKKDCLSKEYVLITDLSRGTSENITYILKNLGNGRYAAIKKFRTGQGKGVSNTCGSNASPTGLISLGNLSYYKGRMENGKLYNWPAFNYRGQRYNYLSTQGLEAKNANIGQPKCPGGVSRGTVFHPISYEGGNTTKGCTGIPIQFFQQYGASLENSCAYNYDGGSSV